MLRIICATCTSCFQTTIARKNILVWNHFLNINPACSAQELNIQDYQYGVFWALTCVNLVKTAHFQRNEFPFSSGNFGVLEDICQSFIRKTLILKAIFFSYS